MTAIIPSLSGGPAGGDLTGSYPNPTVRDGIFAWRPAHNNLKAATLPPVVATAGVALGSGYIFVSRFWLPGPTTVTNMLVQIVTAGAGLTSGENVAGIYNSAGALVASTADQSANWQTGGTVTMPLTAQPGFSLALQDAWYWGAVLAVGSTIPQVAMGTTYANVNVGLGASPCVAQVPGARHIIGYESAAGRSSLVSLNGLTLTDYYWSGRLLWMGFN